MLKKLNQKIEENQPLIYAGCAVGAVVVYYKLYSNFLDEMIVKAVEIAKENASK